MIHDDAEIQRRKPVWIALSDLRLAVVADQSRSPASTQ